MKKLKEKLNAKLSKNGGFTLVEMLIVVAIIAVLIAVSIPVVTGQLEKARQSADAANCRAAYAEAMIQVIEDGTTGTATTDAVMQSSEWDKMPTNTTVGGVAFSDIKKTVGKAIVCTVDSDGNVSFEAES